MLRSWLFVSGSQDKHVKKAKELKPDVFIFDLEDSVIQTKKNEARLRVSKTLDEMRAQINYVRVNGINTDFFIDDLEELVKPGLTGIVLPKVSGRDDLIIADYMLEKMELKHSLEPGSIAIVPIIESARALYNAYEIASSAKRVKCLAFGAEDLMLDMDIKEVNGLETLYARSKIVEVSKALGIGSPIDQIYADFGDHEGLRAEAEKGKNLGFQGKLLIHPFQIEIINNVFSPTADEVTEAKEIMESYTKAMNEGFGVSKVNGKMIDTPIVEKARRILEYGQKYSSS